MKKSLFKEYEALIRPHVSEFYAKAYAVKGNRTEAETLTVDAIVWGASKFSGLVKKERIIELISSYIGDGTHIPAENADETRLLSRAMARIREKGKLKALVLGVGSCVLAAAILAVSIPRLPYDEWLPEETTTQTDAEGNLVQPVIGAVTMKKTDVIKGDDNKITFANYHKLSSALKEKSTLDTPHDRANLIEHFCDAIIVPNGTTYSVYNSVKKEDGSNTVFTLYRMEESGWKSVGTGEAQSNYGEIGGMPSYFHSRVYLAFDRDSNVYVFVLLDKYVTVYKYEAKTGDFKKSDSKLSCLKPMAGQTFSIYHDESTGGDRIYIAYKNPWRFSFAYYDVDKDEFVSVAENIGNSMEDSIIFGVSNETIYAVVQGIDSSKNFLNYYQIGADGAVSQKRIFTSEEDWMTDKEYVYNRGGGRGGITVDETGVVHIIATYAKGGMSSDHHLYLSHYMIDSEGNIEKKRLPKHYYNGYSTYDYEPACALVWIGEQGEIYYMETYYATKNLLVLCELNKDICGESKMIDVIELPDNIIDNSIRFNNNAVVFYSDSKEIIYYECNINNR